MDAQRYELLIACLRRVDAGDPVDSVILDYPEEAGWLREHLIVSDALQMTGEPSAEKKSRARESLLSAVAHSPPPANVPTRLRFGFALAPTALMVLICLGLTAGVAAASGVNLRSVAGDVVDSLVEPLPLSAAPPAAPPMSAEGPQDTIALDSEEGAAGNDTAGGERATLQPNDGGVDEDDATLSDALDDAASDKANLPVEGGSSDETNRPANKPAAANPSADDPPPGENHGGDQGNKPDETGPPAQTPGPSGPPDGNGHDGSGSHGDNAQPGGNGSNGDGSSSGRPDGSNGNPSNGSNGGPDSSNGNPSNGTNGGNGGPDGSNGNPSNGPNGDPSNGSNGSPSNGPNGDPSSGSNGGAPNSSNGDPSNGPNAGGPDPNGGGSSDQCGGGSGGSNPGGTAGGKVGSK